VTDNVEERELDAGKAMEAMSALGSSRQAATEEASQVAVSKEDVQLIMLEMEVSKDVAARALRSVVVTEEGSRVAEALRHLVTK